MMKPKLTFALSLGLAACAGLAPAQSSQQEEGSSETAIPKFPALHPADLNDDGHVTSEEFEKFHQELFAEADANGDGRLDRDEVLAMRKHLRARSGHKHSASTPEWRSGKRGMRDHVRRNPEEFFTTLDANENGTLDRGELPERMAKHFDRMDANNDDGVTLEEFKQAKPDRADMRKRFEEHFKSMDENADGKIQKSEAIGRMSEKFDAMDANGDGAIDTAEIEALRSKHHRHGRHGHDGSARHQRGTGDAPSPDGAPAESPDS